MEPLISAFAIQMLVDSMGIFIGSIMGILIAEKVADYCIKNTKYKDESIPTLTNHLRKYTKRSYTE